MRWPQREIPAQRAPEGAGGAAVPAEREIPAARAPDEEMRDAAVPEEQEFPAQPAPETGDAAVPAVPAGAEPTQNQQVPAGPQLGPQSRVDLLRHRLRQLGEAIWGTKEQLWQRLLKAENKRAQRELEEKYLRDRRQEIEGSTAPVPPRTMPGPQPPSEEARAEHELTQLPPQPWCVFCRMGRAHDEPHRSATAEQRNQSEKGSR